MITSLKGQQMIQKITPIYAKSEIEKAIYQAIGEEWDDADNLIDEILLQLFPQTATWGLVFWENRVGLPINLDEPLEKRRRKVISKMQTRHPITPERMANVLKNYTGADILITEGISSNRFEVLLKTKTGIMGALQEIIKQINKLKPSHMSYNFVIDYLSEYIIQSTFKKWVSEELKRCGSFNSSESIVVTDGWSFKESIVTSISGFYSDEFCAASEETYSSGRGYSIEQSISSLFKRFLSEPFLIASENTYSTGNGFKFDTQVTDKINSYLTDTIPGCSENLYSIGGELVYDN